MEEITGTSKSVLSEYEKGKLPRKIERAKRYLGWLAEQGYNPLGLDNLQTE